MPDRSFEVATGNDPEAALAAALAKRGLGTGLYLVGIAHDDGCPCMEEGLPMAACTCEIVEVIKLRYEPEND